MSCAFCEVAFVDKKLCETCRYHIFALNLTIFNLTINFILNENLVQL